MRLVLHQAVQFARWPVQRATCGSFLGCQRGPCQMNATGASCGCEQHKSSLTRPHARAACASRSQVLAVARPCSHRAADRRRLRAGLTAKGLPEAPKQGCCCWLGCAPCVHVQLCAPQMLCSLAGVVVVAGHRRPGMLVHAARLGACPAGQRGLAPPPGLASSAGIVSVGHLPIRNPSQLK